MKLHRASLGHTRLVYLIVQDKRIRYATGRSRIAYIGTTQAGAARIARSAAVRAPAVFGERGVEEFEIRVVTCKPRSGVKTWLKLERALLLAFRDLYGEPPLCNVQGTAIRETDEFDYFTRKRIERILEDLG